MLQHVNSKALSAHCSMHLEHRTACSDITTTDSNTIIILSQLNNVTTSEWNRTFPVCVVCNAPNTGRQCPEWDSKKKMFNTRDHSSHSYLYSINMQISTLVYFIVFFMIFLDLRINFYCNNRAADWIDFIEMMTTILSRTLFKL